MKPFKVVSVRFLDPDRAQNSLHYRSKRTRGRKAKCQNSPSRLAPPLPHRCLTSATQAKKH